MLKQRIIGLDVFRGWAIFLMIVFHLCYDLNIFHFISIDILHDPFCKAFRALIVSMFLLAVGISLYLVHFPRINPKNLKKRFFQIGGAALLVTAGSYIEFPATWVYFGILHFILLASFTALPFVKYPFFSLVVAIMIFVGYAVGVLETEWLYDLLKTSFHLPKYTRDLVTFFPWFSVVLLGISLAGFGWFWPLFSSSIFSDKWWGNRLLAWMGRHALIIYLLHLPVLFFLVETVHKVVHS
jgi:uncharacterized membrane protein